MAAGAGISHDTTVTTATPLVSSDGAARLGSPGQDRWSAGTSLVLLGHRVV